MIILSNVSLNAVQNISRNHITAGLIVSHIVMKGSLRRLIYSPTCLTNADIVSINTSKSGFAAANTEFTVSRNHMKFVAYATQSAEIAAITSHIGDTNNASTVPMVDIAPMRGVATIPTAPIANTSHASTTTIVPIVVIVLCIPGERLFHQSHMVLNALLRPSIAGRSFSPIVAPRFVIITPTVPLSFSNDPERLSSRVSACSAAFTLFIDSANLSIPSAPWRARAPAMIAASDQNIVVSVAFFCSSDIQLSDFCNPCAISDIDFSHHSAS